MIDREDPEMSIREQCELAGLARSGLYYEPAPLTAEDEELKQALLERQTRLPSAGTKKLRSMLVRAGYCVGVDMVRRLRKEMGLRAVMPKRRLSLNGKPHRKFPYLLKGVSVTRPNQVWATDITYIRIPAGYVYVVAIIDLYSRYIVAWDLSTNLAAGFCVKTLEAAIARYGAPEIFNSDQGCQFTSEEFLAVLERANVQISMDGKGRVFDNILIERFWRTLKQEEVYLMRYENVAEAREGVAAFMVLYNEERPHQSLDYRTPAEVYAEPRQEVA